MNYGNSGNRPYIKLDVGRREGVIRIMQRIFVAKSSKPLLLRPHVLHLSMSMMSGSPNETNHARRQISL